MNEGMTTKTLSANPPTMSSVECEIENINNNLGRIEKNISICLENLRRLDIPANKLNPDDYFRNVPHHDKTEVANAAIKQGDPVEPYVKSGTVRKLSELADYAKQLERQLSDFNEYNIIPTGFFFERNI